MRLEIAWVLVAAFCTSGIAVDHRWDASERRWRDGGVQVTPEAIEVEVADLSELDRTPVQRIGTLVVQVPPDMSDLEYQTWLIERTAEMGGTHFIPVERLQELPESQRGTYAWMGDVNVEQRDVAEGATHYVVMQVRPNTWVSLPTALQPASR